MPARALVGQNEKTCVVYGMPRVAYELGAVEQQLPLACHRRRNPETDQPPAKEGD
ncbi:chemotaxis protein CheB [Rhizobium yanglingense]